MAAGSEGNILVVLHGAARGRSVPTGDVFFSRLKVRDPELAARLRFHQTGTPAPGLNGVALVVFWLGDPLRQKYPDCYADASAIARDAARRGIPVLNHPDGLSNTTKAMQSEIWMKAGIPCAPVACVSTPAELTDAFARMDGPCFLRGKDTHAEREIRMLCAPEQVRAAAEAICNPAALVRIHDVRAEYRRAGTPASSLYSRFHHKARAFVFQGDVKSSHLFFSHHLAVGLSNSLFAREERPKRRLLRKLGFRKQLFNDMIAEDLNYFHTRAAHRDVLVKAVAALGLDVAAVDYSIRPDGALILWEANPYFFLPPGEQSVLAEERLAVARVNASLDWMANCLWAALPKRLAS